MKEVGIAELKARLSEYLRGVRQGRALTVMDRNQPIARVVPYGPDPSPLSVRKPLRKWPTLQQVPLPPPLRKTIDVVDVLLEERQGER